jgi:hypothetical protein
MDIKLQKSANPSPLKAPIKDFAGRQEINGQGKNYGQGDLHKGLNLH